MARNLTPDTREEQDAYDDPTQVERNLQDAETDGAWTTADQDQYDTEVRDNKGDSGAALKQRESKPAGGPKFDYEKTSKAVQKGKRLLKGAKNARSLGPFGGLLVLIVGGAIVTLASFPVLVLQHVEETITHALHDADGAVNVRTRLSFKLKADAVRNGFAESADGKCNVKCKFSTINNKTRKRMLASDGVKFELEKKAFGRYVIKSATFPAEGGKPAITVTNGNDFNNAIKDPVRASAFFKVFNPSTDPFLAYNFVGRLATRFNLDKKTKINKQTEDENKKEFGKQLGLDEDGADGNGPNQGQDEPEPQTEEEKAAKAAKGPAKGVAGAVEAGKVSIKAAKVTDAAAAVCAAYNIGKGVNAAYSVYKVSQYAALFLMIANAASDTRTGTITPAAATFIGNVITRLDDHKTYKDGDTTKPNPFFGKSFTDSTGYKMANYSDNLKLSDRDKRFSLNPTGITGFINQLTGLISNSGEARPALLIGSNQTCGFVNSPGGTAVGCLPAAAAGSLVPIVGNIGAFLVCVGANLTIGFVIGQVISLALPGIIDAIIKNDIGDITADLVGPGAGNAAYVGGGEILGSGMASMYGMTPGTADEVANYKVSIADTQAQYAAAMRVDAASQPMNVYNEYSFLGSFVRSSGILDANLSSTMGALGWMGSLTSLASNAVMPKTHAVASAALLYKDGEDCPDNGLREIGVACNGFGMPSFTMTNGEMNADIVDTVDWMADPANNDGEKAFIDEDTGEATPDTDYAKFMQYCANRQINYGQTTGAIEDPDFAWETGLACACNDDKIDGLICTEDLAARLHFFRTYTMDKTLNDANDDAIPETAGQGGGVRGQGAFKNYVTPKRGWWSGASGVGADNNSQDFGNWRGDPIDAIATWIDGDNGSAWGFASGSDGGPIKGFKGLADIAIGGPTDYAAAANGSLDEQLKGLLGRIRAYRLKDAPDAPTVIRPFHELNGNWYGHSVNSGNLANFRKTAERWSKIAKEVYPEAIWEFSPNGDSANTDVTAEQLYEDGVWDAIGVDRYNQYPCITADFEGGSNLGTVDNPVGVEKWRQFAEKHNVPMGFPEYANNGTDCADNGYWVKAFFEWVEKNAGTGPGQIFSDIWFNQVKENDRWTISPGTTVRQPVTAAAYANVFPI